MMDLLRIRRYPEKTERERQRKRILLWALPHVQPSLMLSG
jgi:hypothetical protein